MDIKRLFGVGSDVRKITFQRNYSVTIAKLLIMLCAVICFYSPDVIRQVLRIVATLFCLLPGTRDKIFAHRGSVFMVLFSVMTGVVAKYYNNTWGYKCTITFSCMMIIFFVTRSIVTKKFYHQILDCVIIGGTISSVISIAERIKYSHIPGYRCMVGFPNPNFFGIAVTLVIFICVYKLAVTNSKYSFIYYGAGGLNAVGIYLCGSMSLWFIAAMGIVIFLFLCRKYKMLAVFVGICALVFIAVVLVPEFVPRVDEIGATTENRVKIWKFAIQQIKEAPIFGRGFFSYKFLYNIFSATDPTLYKASLSHNIIIDSLLCYGIVGTMLILAYLVQYVRDMFKCHTALKAQNKDYIIIKLIVAVAAALFCYGMIDTTYVWSQSGIVILFIAAGIGVEERTVRHLK